MADTGLVGHDFEHFGGDFSTISCDPPSQCQSWQAWWVYVLIWSGFPPLLFKNYVFGVFRVKLSAKNNEKRMVRCTLKLGRHGSFSGLFRLKKPQKVHFYPKMRFLGHNHRWQKIFKWSQNSEYLIFFDESECVWKLRFQTKGYTKKKVGKKRKKFARPFFLKKVTWKKNSAEI